jgi:hypothetical protein
MPVQLLTTGSFQNHLRNHLADAAVEDSPEIEAVHFFDQSWIR